MILQNWKLSILLYEKFYVIILIKCIGNEEVIVGG